MNDFVMILSEKWALLPLSDILSLLVFFVAIWSAWMTSRFNRRQNDFAETDKQLNEILIDKENVEAERQRQADLDAYFYKTGSGSYRLKVYNRGPASALNVRLEMLAGEELISHQDLSDKFPLLLLECDQATELLCPVDKDSPRRAHIKLIWEDEETTVRSKELWRDVF